MAREMEKRKPSQGIFAKQDQWGALVDGLDLGIMGKGDNWGTSVTLTWASGQQWGHVGAVRLTTGQNWVAGRTTGEATLSGRMKIRRWIVSNLWLRKMTYIGSLHLYPLCCIVHREEGTFPLESENLALIIWVLCLECKIWLHVQVHSVCLKSAKLFCNL